ncbi:MAG: hypothetical protein KGM49_02390 [Sphingomonadales bacterium]|nr:hypothetical protein [Sphingomonadales bacterium]
MALAFAVATPGTAFADNPHDPAMRSAAARARDKAIIRRLNRNEMAHVKARDARYAKGWHAYHAYPGRRAAYRRALARNRHEHQVYARRMAAWHRAVAACRAGNRSACRR